jgi:hypothetical protein
MWISTIYILQNLPLLCRNKDEISRACSTDVRDKKLLRYFIRRNLEGRETPWEKKA